MIKHHPHCCRITGTPLTPIIDFGLQPLGNGFLLPEQFDKEYFFHMQVGFDPESKMFQLLEQPNPEQMFHENYAFFSGTSRFMALHFEEFANRVKASGFLKADPFVVELGCNDGILLRHFAKEGMHHLGVEPSLNVATVANEQGVSTTSEFFTAELAEQIVNEHGQADAFLAANVLCHIPTIRNVVKGIKTLLKPTGVVQFEDPYLGDVLHKTSYDQLYDEHVFLFSALSIQYLFALEDLELIDLQPQGTHGGSMRYVLAHQGVYPQQPSVAAILSEEKAQGLDRLETFQAFAQQVARSKTELLELLSDLKRQGKKIAGYGATSKSTTILNYCGIGPDVVDYISDTTPIKQGKYSPGTHIPVKPYEHFQQDRPDYAVLFAWNHQQEILAKELGYTKSGGQWIVHVPQVQIIK